MGYTHCWKIKKMRGEAKAQEIAYQKAIRHCAKVVKAYYKVNGGISGYTAHTEIGTYGGINFNGKGDDGHETFALAEHFNQNEAFEFCKTARKPYDVLVVACLSILKYYLGYGIDVSSDGDADEWEEGVRLAVRVTGLSIENPLREEE